MLEKVFDTYSLGARIRPALLALLPLIVFTYLAFPKMYELLAALAGAAVSFGFVTALGHYCRARGRAVEKVLIRRWGGLPTTQLLRHRDSEIDATTKSRYHGFLSRNVPGWIAPTPEQEAQNPEDADARYQSAIKWLLEHTRDTKRFSMLFSENVSYGFRRNALGIKWFAVFCAATPLLLVCIELFVPSVSFLSSDNLSYGFSAAISVILLLWWICVVSENWVKDAGIAYATRLLAACEEDTPA